jgi:uncharacterized protein YegP (UPF0339 family)
MKKVVGGMALVVGLCLFVAGGPDRAFGQAKSRTPSPPTKKEPMAGTIEVYKAKDGYRFRIKDLGGKTVAMPTKGYDDKDECLKALDFIKATLNQVKPTDVKD